MMAFIVPWLMHGIYNFLIMSGHPLLIMAFIPFLVFLYRIGLRRMKELNDQSVFNPSNINFTNQQENNYMRQENNYKQQENNYKQQDS